MYAKNPDALTCDMAETYGVFNMQSLPARLAATLAVGLRDDSRIKMAVTETPVRDEIVLLAHIADCVRWIQWSMTQAAQEGADPPKSILNYYLGIDQEEKTTGFASPQEYEEARRKILEGK